MRLVHRTRDRMRLRISEKRKDIRYFVDMYEILRKIPGVTDVVINPVTGSVLLYFPEELGAPVLRSLQRIGLLNASSEAQRRPGVLCRMEQFFAKEQGNATQVRMVLTVIIVALAIHQVRRGILLAPGLTILWYLVDFAVSHMKAARL
ncbi:MAG: hypothetical protein LJE70_01415 [Chromatiaceae bacterium]|nr:hypothetical protein [Chromatiaceae bacterium]